MESNPGSENLEVMSDASNYLSFVGRLVASRLPMTGRVLDIGAGNGIQTAHVGLGADRLLCVESDERMKATLEDNGYEVVRQISGIETGDFAAVYSINCLEHIEDDQDFLCSVNRVLIKNGTLVLYVPALPMLYSSMDKKVGHFRRYTKEHLRLIVEHAGFTIQEIRYADVLGVFASLLFKILRIKSGTPSRLSVQIYDKLVFPASQCLDLVFQRIVGKNLFVVAVKH